MAPPVGYIAYIDEAGDDGLRLPSYLTNRPDTSEWMVMSAIVARIERETQTVAWVKEALKRVNQHQLTHLHFRELNDSKKLLVSDYISGLPIRVFSVLSHKKNMRGYVNLHAEKAKVNRTAWFFCWLSRLLLERVTHYCSNRTIMDYKEIRSLRVEFSSRGGVRIEDIKAYYRYLYNQSQMKLLYLNLFDLSWDVMDIDCMSIYPNKMRAGLQLADVVASAFYQAVERTPEGRVRPEPAKKLLPRVCLRPGRPRSRYGYGVKVMPTWILPKLPTDQQEILDYYIDA